MWFLVVLMVILFYFNGNRLLFWPSSNLPGGGREQTEEASVDFEHHYTQEVLALTNVYKSCQEILSKIPYTPLILIDNPLMAITAKCTMCKPLRWTHTDCWDTGGSTSSQPLDYVPPSPLVESFAKFSFWGGGGLNRPGAWPVHPLAGQRS